MWNTLRDLGRSPSLWERGRRKSARWWDDTRDRMNRHLPEWVPGVEHRSSRSVGTVLAGIAGGAACLAAAYALWRMWSEQQSSGHGRSESFESFDR